MSAEINDGNTKEKIDDSIKEVKEMDIIANEIDRIINLDCSNESSKKIVNDSNSSSSATSNSISNVIQATPSNQSSQESTVDVKNLSDAQLVQYFREQEIKKMREREIRRELKSKDAEKNHQFWNTQPMPALTDILEEGINGPMNSTLTIADIRPEPFNMPAGFEWSNIDVHDMNQAQEVYKLLTENYVEDDDCMFRFDYSIPFLQWALTPPGHIPDLIVGVRNSKNKKLMGCITAVSVHVNVRDQVQPMVEINFLCVHKKLRTKRLAPVLIKEITRRVNLLDRWQAVYTAGVVLPKPIARCRYHHRTLNPKKLVEVKFTYIPQKQTLSSMIKNLKLPAKPKCASIRPLVLEDIPTVFTLLSTYLMKKTKLYQKFTSNEELAHTLLPRSGVVNSYVVEALDGTVTDLCSFYHLPSTIIGHNEHKKLNAVYSYYNVATSMPLVDLMRDALILARNDGADVFNALDLMENKEFLEPLLFGAGDGNLQYYVYNWKSPELQPHEIGLVLL